jgi:hypothetical protein
VRLPRALRYAGFRNSAPTWFRRRRHPPTGDAIQIRSESDFQSLHFHENSDAGFLGFPQVRAFDRTVRASAASAALRPAPQRISRAQLVPMPSGRPVEESGDPRRRRSACYRSWRRRQRHPARCSSSRNQGFPSAS